MIRKILLTLMALCLILGEIAVPTVIASEADGVSADNNPGTLKYTPSADGKEMTISYKVADKNFSYTVPNNDNYLFGGYAGVDDLGRSLYSSDEVGIYEDGKKYIGLFYFLWLGEHGDYGIYDLQKIIDEVGVKEAKKSDCGKYGPAGAMHFFAEPLYGYYYSSDAWVMRKHVELLTNANIDFLYIDVTNGFPYVRNALQLMKILHEFNEQGYDAPQVVFYTHSSAESVVGQLYNMIYKPEKYPDTWFRIDGKPVIVAPDDIKINAKTSINDVFTVKREQWPNDSKLNKNAWPWMDFEWPQRIFTDKEGRPSAVSVSIAQHSGTVCFSSSSLYSNNSNRGRSYSNPDGVTHKSSKYGGTLRDSYRAWQKDPSLTMQGINFQQQFDYAIASKAEYILVTGWNEWVAQRQNTKDVTFVDTASMEFSRDAEMMRGGYFDNYYMQLIYNVQKAKGTAPTIIQDARKQIDISGNFEQWSDVVVEYKDSIGDTVNRKATGFGKKMLTNKTGRNDIVNSKVICDSRNLYFYAETAKDITEPKDNTSWMQLYINSDSKATTGWYGYDYIVNYDVKDASSTTVAKYSGKDNSFAFDIAGDAAYRVEGNKIMIAVPLKSIGISNSHEINLEFKWADSTTVYDEMEDFYCDGDTAPLGRLNYIYRNYIEGLSIPIADPETESEKTTESEKQSEPEKETVSADETDSSSDSEKSSAAPIIIAAIAVVTALAVCAVFVIRKNRKRTDFN